MERPHPGALCPSRTATGRGSGHRPPNPPRSLARDLQVRARAAPRLGPSRRFALRCRARTPATHSHNASRLWRSPVMRSGTVPRLVATVSGPLARPLSCALGVSTKKGSGTHSAYHPSRGLCRRRCSTPSPTGNRFARKVQIRCLDQNHARARLIVDGESGRIDVAKMKTTIMKAAMSGLYHAGAHRSLPPIPKAWG